MSLVGAIMTAQAAASSLQSVASALGIGPNYDPKNGGEIRRQLAASNWPADRLEAYLAWTKQYQPGVYAGSESCWDVNPNVSAWFAAHEANGKKPMNASLQPIEPGTPNPMGDNPANSGPANKKNEVTSGAKFKQWWSNFKSGTLPWWHYALAGAVVILIGYGAYRIFRKKRKKNRRY